MDQKQIIPEDYIITRKRKKYKFAKFALSPLCFEFDEWKIRPVDVIEIGAGDGLFSVELATRHPEQSFVAIDVKADRLQKGAYEAESRGLTNINFVRARADQIKQIADEHSVQSVWVTFADPFPKTRSSGRRLTHQNFLKLYASVLGRGGNLYIKHDDVEFFHWSLEQLVADKWQLKELSFDLHEADLSDDYKIMTTYERRWQSEGRRTNFVRVTCSNP